MFIKLNYSAWGDHTLSKSPKLSSKKTPVHSMRNFSFTLLVRGVIFLKQHIFFAIASAFLPEVENKLLLLKRPH